MVTLSACALLCLATSADNVTLLEFTADWCAACRTSEPTVQRLVADGYPVQRIQVDHQREIASRFRIQVVPCFVLVAAGREVERVEGPASYARLVQMFERAGVGTPVPAARSASESPTIRGQSPRASGGFALPRPFASIAKGLAGRSQEPPMADHGIQVTHDVAAVPTEPSSPQRPPLAAPIPTSPATHPAANAADLDPRIVQQALRAAVRIRVQDGTGHSLGTGTIVDMHGHEALVVTCGHIFRDSGGKGRITVDVFASSPPRTVDGTLISYDLDRDIGLVAIVPGSQVAPVSVAPAAFQVQRGLRVFSVGCDQGADPSVRSSHITSIDRYTGPPNLQVAGMPVDGRSGGGLFSADGYLIGVCNAADPEDQEGIFASLPILHWELDKIGQRAVYDRRAAAIAAAPARQSPSVPEAVPGREPSHLGGPGQAAAGSLPREMPVASLAENAATGALAPTDTEIICIVRSRANPQGSERLLVLDRPSRELLDRLSQESQRRPAEVAGGPARSASLAPLATVPGAGAPPQHNRANPLHSDINRDPVIRAQSNER
jgi:thiol-disulfide isomerase/thioredoxin